MPERERRSIDAELRPPFTILAPTAVTTPFVFCSPHSGRVYPKAFLQSSRLDAHTLRKSEDCYVDELFAGVVSLGAPLISARFPRAFIDVNREPYELDPELFCDALPPFANSQSVRVAGGLGTIARIVADNEEIYRERMSVAAALARIDRLYKPFHAALAQLVEEARSRFGIAVLIDCHSMPSSSSGQPQSLRPEFVLGDRFGVSCDGKLTRAMKELLADQGFAVHINRPYAGGFITEHYGRPQRGLHAMQIEVNRALYMNESTFERTSGFEPLQRALTRLAALLTRDFPGTVRRQAAAE